MSISQEEPSQATATREASIDAPRILPFQATHARAFRDLNLAWIREHWEPEATDFHMLDNPIDTIIKPGGHIAIALQADRVIGTCALVKLDATHYELAKMAVDPQAKGMGIGRQLGHRILTEARARGAQRVSLDSNRVLVPAINLYRSLGFEEIEGPVSVYERSNIHMELHLY